MTKRLSAILRLALVSFSLISCTVAAHAADYPIYDDLGGNFGEYLKRFEAVKASGKRVVIHGRCMSACTFVLGVIPRDRICVKEGASLVFHAATYVGTKVIFKEATNYWYRLLPNDARNWTSKNKAFLDLEPHSLHGAELEAMIKRC